MRTRVQHAEYWILAGIILLGIMLRLFSLSWNTFPHADIQGDALVGSHVIQYGHLWEEPPDPSAERHPTFFPIDSRLGVPFLQHGPVWAGLGGIVTQLWGGRTQDDVYHTLRMLSVLSGAALLLLLWTVTRRMVGRNAALVCTLWAALSYLLIDYSGNGAFYMLQGTLYLLWALIALRKPTSLRAATLGAVTGLAYFVNYQSIVLLPSLIALEFFQRKTMRTFLWNVAVGMVLTGLVASPWLIRNFILVGDPFAHHLVNTDYVFTKSGIHATVRDFVYVFPSKWEQCKAIGSMIVTSWLPNNAFYVARKLFILAPLAFIFFCYGLVDQVIDPGRRKKLLPVLLVFAAHALISASWPITKFRYFVPLLPLVFLLSMDAIHGFLKPGRLRTATLCLITVLIALGSVLTYFSVPTHTYYYDGAITTDPFSGRGEWNYLRDNGYLPSA